MRNSKQLGIALLLAGVFVGANAAASSAVSCGDTITVDTVMTTDLVCADQIALRVEGPATLDMNGHNIACAYAGTLTERGIDVHGSNAVIRNGSVSRCTSGLAAGVYLGDGGHHTVENVRVDTSLRGFWVNSSKNKLYNNVAESCDYGFVVDFPYNNLAGNAASWGGTGFEISQRGVTLKDNRAVNNTNEGFILTGVSNQGKSTWKDNVATGNGSDGFRLEYGSGNRLIKNVATGNEEAGFAIASGSDGNKLSGNTAMVNDVGILVSSTENSVRKNVANGNYVYGIQLEDPGAGNVVDGNVSAGSGDADLAENDECVGNVWSDNDFGSSTHPCIQ